MTRLYTLVDEILRLQHAAYDATDEEFEQLKEQFGSTKMALNDKLDNIGRLMREMEESEEMLKREEERLYKRRKALTGRRESLLGYVRVCLGQGNNYKTPLFSWSWRKSEAVEIDDPAKVPAAYRREKITYEPDKRQLSDDLKCGAEIPGARLIERFNLSLK